MNYVGISRKHPSVSFHQSPTAANVLMFIGTRHNRILLLVQWKDQRMVEVL